MSDTILNDISKSQLKRVPSFRAGYTVRVHQRIKEGSKERVQKFEGLVIKLGAGNGINKTFTVRKIVDGIGVEKMFPLHAPSIEQIDIVKKGKVRRSKLYYMRERSGKSARLRERELGEIEMIGPEEVVEEEVVEETAEQAETPVEEPKEEVKEEKAEETPAEEVKEEEKTEDKAE